MMSGLFANFRTIPNLKITDATASTSSITGALVVSGGVGVGGRVISDDMVANFVYTKEGIFGQGVDGINVSASNLRIQTGQSTGNAIPASIIFSTTTSGSGGTSYQLWQERARISGNTGNFLINTITDNNIDRLQINGSIKADLGADSTVFAVSQASGARILSFGSNGLFCNSVVSIGKNTVNSNAAALEISSGINTRIGLIVQGVSSQISDLQQWRNASGAALAIIDSAGRLFAQNITVTVITASQFRLSALNSAPTSATDTGTTGEIKIDANFIYVCVAANSWKRAPFSTW